MSSLAWATRRTERDSGSYEVRPCEDGRSGVMVVRLEDRFHAERVCMYLANAMQGIRAADWLVQHDEEVCWGLIKNHFDNDIEPLLDVLTRGMSYASAEQPN